MSDYCAIADVQTQLAAMPTFTDGPPATTPSLTQAIAIIANVTAELNGLLRSRGYTLPVVDSNALNYLNTVAVYGSCALILQAAYLGDPVVDSGAQVWFKLYGDAKAAIMAGALGIDDNKDPSTFASGFTADADGNPYTPFMTRDWSF